MRVLCSIISSALLVSLAACSSTSPALFDGGELADSALDETATSLAPDAREVGTVTDTTANDAWVDVADVDDVVVDSGAVVDSASDAVVDSGAGAVDASPSCVGCVVLKSDVRADGFVFVVAEGRILWDRDIFRALDSITTSGTDYGAHGTTGCGVTHRRPVVHNGYLYYLERLSSGSRVQLSRLRISDRTKPCEKLFQAVEGINDYAVDAAGGALYVSHRPDASAKPTLGRYDLSTLTMTTVGLSHLHPRLVADGKLFGRTNVAFGGLTYSFARAATSDGVPTELVKNIGVPDALTTDATWVYYEEGDKLFKVPRGATGLVTPVHVPGPSGVIVEDGDHVVWFTYGASTFSRMPLAGGAIETRSVGPHKIMNVAADATRFYVMANPGFSQTLLSLPR